MIGVLTLFGTVSAQQMPSPKSGVMPVPKPAPPTFTSDQIAQGKQYLVKVAKALGGVENFKALKSVYTESKMTMTTPQGNMSAQVNLTEVMPGQFAQVVNSQMGEQKIVFNGTDAWMTASGQTKKVPDAQIESMKSSMHRNINYIMAHADNPEMTVAYTGQIKLDDADVIDLEFLTPDTSVFAILLDPATNLPKAMQFAQPGGAGGRETLMFENYKEYGGIKFPTTISRKGQGMQVQTDVTDIKVNQPYDTNLFKMPDGL